MLTKQNIWMNMDTNNIAWKQDSNDKHIKRDIKN